MSTINCSPYPQFETGPAARDQSLKSLEGVSTFLKKGVDFYACVNVNALYDPLPIVAI